MTTKYIADDHAYTNARMEEIRAERRQAIAGEPVAADVPAPEEQGYGLYGVTIGPNYSIDYSDFKSSTVQFAHEVIPYAPRRVIDPKGFPHWTPAGKYIGPGSELVEIPSDRVIPKRIASKAEPFGYVTMPAAEIDFSATYAFETSEDEYGVILRWTGVKPERQGDVAVFDFAAGMNGHIRSHRNT